MTTPPVSSPALTALGGPGEHWLATAAHDAFPDGGDCSAFGRFAVCALGPDPQVTSEARNFTRLTLRGWGLGGLVDDAAVVVSELLSNALRYGMSGPLGRPLSPHPVWLGLMCRGAMVMCAVTDPGRQVPVVREPDYFAETGRGLHVVDCLSRSWGWTDPDGTGKAVWAVLAGEHDAG